MKKRLLSILLVLTMIFLCIPAGIFAEDGDNINEGNIELTTIEGQDSDSDNSDEPAVAPEIEEMIQEPATEGSDQDSEEKEPTKAPVTDELAQGYEEEETTNAPSEEEPVRESEEEPVKVLAEAETTQEPLMEESTQEIEKEELILEPVIESTEETGEGFPTGADQKSNIEESSNKTVEPEEAATEEIPTFEIDGEILVKYNGEDEEVTIPNGVKQIGEKAFYANKTIKKVIFPDTVEAIGSQAFAECSNLETIVISDESKLETIWFAAFKNDTKLDISFADNVKNIVDNAFEGIQDEVVEEKPTVEQNKNQETDDSESEETRNDNNDLLSDMENNENDEADIEKDIIFLETAALEATIVTATPNKETAAANEEVIISATVNNLPEGTTAKFRWYKSPNGEDTWTTAGMTGDKTAEMTFTANSTRLGFYYVCVATINGATYSSNIVKVNERTEPVAEPTVTVTPNKDAAAANEEVILTAIVNNLPTGETAKFRWYKSPNGKDTWTTAGMTGDKTAEMTFTANSTRLGFYYVCIATIGEATYTSNIVKVNEKTEPVAEPTLTATPNKDAAAANEEVVMTAVVNNLPTGTTAKFRWYKSPNGEDTWTTAGMTGDKTAEMTFTANSTRLGFYYVCIATIGEATYTSNIVKVNEKTEPVAEPTVTATSNKEVAAANEEVILTAVVNNLPVGATAKFRWYKSPNGEDTWTTAGMTGDKTAEMTFSANSNRLGFYYVCIATIGEATYTSNMVKVNEKTEPVAEPSVTATPNKEAAAANEEVIMTAVVNNLPTGATAKFRWYKSPNGEDTWTTAGMTGDKTAEMTFTANSTRLGFYYVCIATIGEATYTSNIVKVNEKTEPVAEPTVIATSNKDAAAANEEVVMTAVVNNLPTGATAKFRWYKSPNGEDTWTTAGMTGDKTAEMTFTANSTRLGFYYVCIATIGEASYTSNMVKVNEKTEPVIEPTVIATPNKETASENEEVILTAVVNNLPVGATAKFRWYKSPNGEDTWTTAGMTGDKTAEMTFTANSTRLSYYYVCVATIGEATYSSNIIKVEEEKKLITKDDVTYEILTETTVFVKFYSGHASSLVIPETVEGYTVTEIGPEAFMDNKELISINLPNTITVIGARAFKDCSNLSTMTTP